MEQRRDWGSFLRALVRRYGPSGSFWQANPNTPYRPIREWQIWNEQNTSFFAHPVSPSAYDRLLQLSSNALRGADPQAQVVIGGMLGRPAHRPPFAYPADVFLEKMYRAMGQELPKVKRIMELNPAHPLVTGLRDAYGEREDKAGLGESVELLYGMALLAEGGELTDPSRFVNLLSSRLEQSL